MQSLNLLIKPASSSCNMACSYCFYADEGKHRKTENYGFMSFDVLESVVRRAFESGASEITFLFQGGEPTLVGLPFYEKFIAYEQLYNRANCTVSHAIQTNGYCLEEAWVQFFKQHDFLVGVSLDGTREVHNACRTLLSGQGTFDAVMGFIALLKQNEVAFNILCVVTKQSASRAEEIYNFFYEQNFQYLQFIPCMDSLEEQRGQEAYSLTPSEYAKFYKALFDCWYQDCVRCHGVSIRNFDNYLMVLLGYTPEHCGMRGECALSAVVEADGSVYPCDFYALDAYRLGSMMEDSIATLFQGERATQFLSISKKVDERCHRCRYGALCRGGCRRDKVMDKKGELTYFCSGVRNFFDYSFARFRQIATQKQHPYDFTKH